MDLIVPKVSICVMDVTDGGQTHVRKITVEMTPQEAVAKISRIFGGQMVTRKKGPKKRPDLRRK